MTGFVVFVAIGYLVGSIPFGLIVGRVFGQVDVRRHGSGMTGTTNVLRTVGVRAAALVLLLDMGKTVLAVLLARVFTDSVGVEVVAALSAILGHNWPLYSGFRGGRGTAAGWGGLLVLSPIAGLVASFIGLLTVAISRYVSLGSVLGATSGAATVGILSIIQVDPLAYIWYGSIAGAIIVARHRDNISRLLRGEERKLGHRAEGL